MGFIAVDHVIYCLLQQYVDSVESTIQNAELYEGKQSNLVQFDTIVGTTDESTPMVGRNMWRLNLYGSERENGQGPRYAEQEQVLSDYFSSRELTNPGDSLNFRTIDAYYDMTGLDCKKVKYLCTEFSRNPSSSVEYELIPVPNERTLRDCMEVTDEMCKGKNLDMIGVGKEIMVDIIQNFTNQTCLGV